MDKNKKKLRKKGVPNLSRKTLPTQNNIIEYQKLANQAKDYFNKGVSLGKLNRDEEAIECYDKAIDIDAKYKDAYNNKGVSLGNLNRDEEAIECYDKAIDIDAKYKDAYNNKGVSLGKLNRDEEAIECFDKAIDIDAKYKDAYNNKGVSLGNLNRDEEAIECYDKVIKIDSNYKEAHNNKGNSLGKLNRDEEAIECYDKAIDIDAKYKEAYNNKGVSLGKLNRDEEAIECYDKAIDIDAKYKEAYYNKGNSLGKLNRDEEAIECFDKAIDIDAKYKEAYNNKGVSLGKLNRDEEAIECYDKAIDIDVKYKEAYNNKGNSLGNLNRDEEAIECYDKVIDIDAKYKEAYIGKGVSLGKLNRDEEAIECFDNGIKIDDEYKEAHNNKGVALGKLNRYEEAIECYDKAIDIDAKYREAYVGKGIICYNTKKSMDKKHFINWVSIYIENIQNSIVDESLYLATNYIISMLIYHSYHLLLKQEDTASTIHIKQMMENYINEIVNFEHKKNSEEINNYYKENTNHTIIEGQNKDIFYQYSSYTKESIYNIKNEQIYFSDPQQFNDPFDPLIKILDKEHSKQLLQLLNFRISCLSTINNHLLLWSHYANKHQGICIAYDISELITKERIIFRKIDLITEKIPKPKEDLIFKLQNDNNQSNNQRTLINTFTQKQQVWEYEKEYRLIWQTEKEFLQDCPIKEIYLGKDMSDEDKQFIKQLINEKNTDKNEKEKIKFFEMSIKDDDIFTLESIQKN